MFVISIPIISFSITCKNPILTFNKVVKNFCHKTRKLNEIGNGINIPKMCTS